MLNESQINLFKALAVRIVGQWHYFDGEGLYCFSLIPAIGESGGVHIKKGSETYTTTYRIDVDIKNNVELSIAGIPSHFTARIVILTNDCLILHYDNTIEILERKPDFRFVEDVLNKL